MATTGVREVQTKAQAASDVPTIPIDSWERPFEGSSESRLNAILPDFLVSRRWYRAKARTIRHIDIQDLIAMHSPECIVLVIRVQYVDAESDAYLLPLSVAREETAAQLRAGSDEVVAVLEGPGGEKGILCGAFSNPAFRDGLLNAIATGARFQGRVGQLVASRTSAFNVKPGDQALKLESFVSRAEQSNTSIIYRDQYILKLFRKIEPGINPDIEIGRFLTERGFANTPAVFGTIEYRTNSDVSAAAILQQFVRNRGDAWKFTLDSLAGFFERALASGRHKAPQVVSSHPIRLMDERLPGEARELLGSYVDSASLLGTRTAQMHVALTDAEGGTDFAPEAFARPDAERLYESMLGQAEMAFRLLRAKQDVLSGETAEAARHLLHLESDVRARFASLRSYPISAARIRSHGDYHLGQVLYTGNDFMIIDFEGEPARPLAERRAKGLAMRDVAGMVRSFQYAAYAALFGQVSGVSPDPEKIHLIESWAGYWTAWVSAIYTKAYFAQAASLPFIPAKQIERLLLLDAFLLEKALYEVSYELNNRPDWVRIPLKGILNLVA